jgi:uncharacterized membrane-anchored protein
MMGNISTLHWYHRRIVTEDCRKPFGKLVGLGTLIIGIALILFALLTLISGIAQSMALSVFAIVVLILGFVAGTVLTFYAMFKYNKGIF